MDDGTQALDGASNPSLQTPDLGGGQAPQLPAAPQANADPQAPQVDLGGGQPPQLPPAADPTVKQPSGIDRLFGAVADFLSPPQQSHTVIDEQGNRSQVQDPRLTRGQQVKSILGTALQGAATAAQAPPGPGNLGQGFGAAVGQQFAQAKEKAQQDEQQAEGDFARKQKAKQDALNYQLGVRQLAHATFQNAREQTVARQDDVGFGQKMNDQEAAHGSIDLGVYAGAHDIHEVQNQDPKFWDSLSKGLIVAHPVYNGDGTYAGLHIWKQKPETASQAAPKGSQFATFELPTKQGEQPHLAWHTAADGQYTNGDIARFNQAAQVASAGYDKQQSDLKHVAAETNQANAGATKDLAEAGTQASVRAKNYAEAGKAAAEARKAKIEANNESGDGEGTGNLQQDAHMMVDGLASPEQFSKRSKDYNAMLPEANRYSLQKYGVPFDAEVAQGRYLARRDTIKAFGAGKEGDQIQTFNQFLAHAGDLSRVADQLRQTNSPLLNTPLKNLRKAMGETEYARIEPMIAAVRTEHANFLNNNHALHDTDISEAHDMLSDDMNLWQMQDAIKGFAHTAIARVGSLNQRYRRVVGTGDVPEILDPYSRKVINSLGMQADAQGALGTAWTQTPQTQQNVTSPPPPQGGNQGAHNQGQGGQPAQPNQPNSQPGAPVPLRAPVRPTGIPAGYRFFQDSRGGGHWIDPVNLPAAQKIDPHLRVAQQ